MKKYILFCIVMMLLSVARLRAQDGYNDRAKKYIEQYYPLAIEEQIRSGIPAAVTLGQGILETEAGASELMTKANNHFGIKCKNDWQGDKFLHTDDAPNECFKKYRCAEESYKDHSDYLKRNPRYATLFSLRQTDYKGWAVCLKKCGYATNPQYAQNLIKVIEDFNLQDYTYSAFDSSLLKKLPGVVVAKEDKPDIKPIAKIADSARNFVLNKQANVPPTEAVPVPDADNKVVAVNGLKAFYAHKGDMLLQYAVKYKVRYAHLLEMNDLPDGSLPFNTYVYLEKKLSLGTKPTHIVKEGENLLMVSQAEGVQLKRLMAMNMLNPNEEPVTGSVIYLQSATAIKPDVRINAIVAHKGNAIVTGPDDPKQDNDYIAINKSVTKPTPAVTTPTPKPVPASISAPAVAHVSAPPVVTKPAPAPAIDTMAIYKQQLDAVAPTHEHHANVVKPTPAPAIDTMAMYKQQLDAVAPTHEAVVKPKPTTPPHVIVVKTTPAEPKQPVYVQPAVMDKPVASAEKEDATSEEEFSKLKAELDKVVYADDSKIVAKMESAQPQKKQAEEQVPKGAKYYKVKRGETATSIAKRNGITVNQLLKLNDIDANEIRSGENLRVK